MSDEISDEEWFRNATPEVMYLNEEQWDEFQRLLDEPPKDIPKLRELFRRANGTTDRGRHESREAEVASEDEEKRS